MLNKFKLPGKMFSQVMESVFLKPATVLYPFVKIDVVDKFRGKLKFDQEKCIGCKICMRDCPSDAIDIQKVAEKKFKAILALDKCIYCGQCTDSCPKDALEMTKDFELAQFDRKHLQVEI
jgi:formate hydrogenlyase subunit 6/NADH:ubiquinone oxidoreductase subunit I